LTTRRESQPSDDAEKAEQAHIGRRSETLDTSSGMLAASKYDNAFLNMNKMIVPRGRNEGPRDVPVPEKKRGLG
jgi:hypothetical protein